MQDSEKKAKHAPKHAKPAAEKPEPKPIDPLQEDEYDELMLDEAEIPIRLRKKPSSASKKKTSKKKSRRKASAKRRRRVLDEDDSLLFSEKKFGHKKNPFEVLVNSHDGQFIKPLVIFGVEIRFWPLFVLLIVAMLIIMLVLNNGNVEALSQSVTVVGLNSELENCKILILSDMNGKRFGDEQSALLRTIEQQDYDLIFCLGDMVGKDGDAEPFYELLEGLDNPENVYFICGDSDPGPYVEVARDIEGTLEQIVLEDWILGAIERGANYVDAPVCVEYGKSEIWLTPTNFLNIEAVSYAEDWKEQMKQEEDGVISGLTSDYDSLPFTSYRYQLATEFYAAVNTIESSDMLIGLSHQVPNDAFIVSAATHDDDEGKYLFEPEIILAGHYCGGVWKVPFVGAIYVPNRMLPRYGWFPDQEDVSGLSQIGETQVYITGGLSTTSAIPVLPFRLFNQPELTTITLTATLPENMLNAAG